MSGKSGSKLFGLSRLGWSIVLAAVLIVAAANAHLVYVAFAYQPDCVPHLKEKAGAGEFRAAKPSC